MIEAKMTLPAQACIYQGADQIAKREPDIRFRKEIPTTWIKLTLYEGRNRQVRKMTAKVGHPTLRLIRYAIGNLNIKNMKPGELRELTKADLSNLFQQKLP
jgi:23S rRNA pseudouridine2457 synthase